MLSAAKHLVFKTFEILRSLRSLRMTGMETLAIGGGNQIILKEAFFVTLRSKRIVS